jgi:hypothetical protein
MGAKTAMAVALRKNIPISSLISVDNAPVDAALHGAFAKYTQGMKRIEDAQLKKQSEADAILKEYEESLPVRQFLLTNLMRGPDGIMKWRVPIKILTDSLNNMADFPFTDPEAARWEGPALFVRGTKSHYVADEMLPTIGRFFPRFQLSDVDCGHWVISEKPEDFRKGEAFLLMSCDVMDHLLTEISSCCRLPPGPRVDYPIVCDVLTIDLDFTTCTVIIILVHNSSLNSAPSVDYIDTSLFSSLAEERLSCSVTTCLPRATATIHAVFSSRDILIGNFLMELVSLLDHFANKPQQHEVVWRPNTNYTYINLRVHSLVTGPLCLLPLYLPGPIMSKDQRELKKACEENDIPRVSELFNTRPLSQKDATSCTFRISDLALMRCLLEHGADLRRYLEKNAPPSLDMIKLFVEFGYDVKAEGHKIIQLVHVIAVPPSSFRI